METMKRKWGKPVTSVQVFTPQEYVAGCGESEEPAIKGDCGAGIENNSEYAAKLAKPGGGYDALVRFEGENEGTTHPWYVCPEKHIFTMDELSSSSILKKVVWAEGTFTQQVINFPENLYGYEANGAAHIFYFDKDYSGFEHLPMS